MKSQRFPLPVLVRRCASGGVVIAEWPASSEISWLFQEMSP
jgi:hypothetical protein